MAEGIEFTFKELLGEVRSDMRLLRQEIQDSRHAQRGTTDQLGVQTVLTLEKVNEVVRRVDGLEESSPLQRLSVIETTVGSLSSDVQSLRRAFYTFSIGIASAAIVFAFGVSQLG